MLELRGGLSTEKGIIMVSELTASPPGTAAPAGTQNVAVTAGQATMTVHAPTSTGDIWFSFSIYSGQAFLTINYNGQTHNNVEPGDYLLRELTTPLNLTAEVMSGSTRLAWLQY